MLQRAGVVAIVGVMRASEHVNSRDNPERLKVLQVDHETDVEKWFIDRHRSEKSVPQATVVGSFT